MSNSSKIRDMPKKILLVEDEAALRKTLGTILKQEGYKMVLAADGETGLRMAKTKKPDLILLDLILPKIHGFDVLTQLKSDPSTKQIPVIVLTNLEKIEDIEKAIEMGATTYLIKARYSLEEVVEKVRKIFEE